MTSAGITSSGPLVDWLISYWHLLDAGVEGVAADALLELEVVARR